MPPERSSVASYPSFDRGANMRLMLSSKQTLTRRGLAVLAGATLAIGALAGCTHKKDTASTDSGPLPAASDLMSQSEQVMSSLSSAHFTIDVKGTLPGVPLQSAQGDLTKEGNAKGTAKITELGSSIEADFVILGQDFYLNAGTGGFQKLPLATASSIFDPSAILDPNRGIVKLMSAATDTKTVAKEQVNGKDAYKVSLTADPASVSGLIPGAGAGTKGDIWIDATTHEVVKGVFTVPGANGAKGATVTVGISNFNVPVTISAP
jgi:lipoprotein LprG